ncbi:Hypothetical Protein FCC1311_078022 [Hondaea fermentalgiana]|uniref:Uncharacterized protein n=1 Tax=Hondaea fermentalgiana TaxID=2315210 RepID=A0A2R5GP75_9STRA|nr:Hypothetical Protein FCC1311_078022 [Hondaea fermentalgiana]|eukprot:GBG31578.1 Hypothetical Protein FCC1311_078022 [Hondaea fermentalgiana]
MNSSGAEKRTPASQGALRNRGAFGEVDEAGNTGAGRRTPRTTSKGPGSARGWRERAVKAWRRARESRPRAVAAALVLLVLSAVLLWRQGGSKTSKAMVRPEPARMPVFVVEQHGNVLDFWIEKLQGRRGVSIVHIDSHSDMMDVDDEVDGRGADRPWLTPEAAARMHRNILKDAGIGDFITRAIIAGIVDMVHWVRSDFTMGMYNGPNVGRYLAKAGIDRDEKLGCFAAVNPLPDVDPQGSIDKGKIFTSASKFGHGREPANGATENLATCEEDSLMPDYTIPLEIVVSTLDIPIDHPRRTGSPWILDIDFDFLATNDPCVELFEIHGFSLEWVQEHLQGAVFCPSEDEEAEMLSLRKLFLLLVEPNAPTNAAAVEENLAADSTCKVSQRAKLELLLRALKDFTPGERKAWKAIFSRDMLEWSADFMVSMFDEMPHLGPVGRPTKSAVRAQAARLEAWIQREVAVRGPPVCVTLSKSHKFDHYLPTSLANLIEYLVIGMVRRLFRGAQFTFHSDFDGAAYDHRGFRDGSSTSTPVTTLAVAPVDRSAEVLPRADTDLLRGSLLSLPVGDEHEA